MGLFKLIKNNIKTYVIMGIIILFGVIGVTLASVFSNFNPIAVNTTTDVIDARVEYADSGNGSTITGNNILPISDSEVSLTSNDDRILKVTFNVTGVSGNPENTIYDVALHDIDIDCELRTTDLKWRLYKGSQLLSSGNLSPTFDTMAGDRLVLTEEQQSLSSTDTHEYTFLLWISESCTGDITECDPSQDQSKYLGKALNANIKIELSTKTKKRLVRVTGSEGSCDYIATEVPVCNNLTYNGEEQQLVNITSSASGISNNGSYKLLPLGVTPIANTNSFTIKNNVGINAGEYAVILKLEDGYKWTDGSTDDKCIYCSIAKRNVTITTLNQTIDYGGNISSDTNKINFSGLASNHTIDRVSLNSSIVDVGQGNIGTNNVVIKDRNNNDVTKNYNIVKQDSGKVTINCLNIAEMPTVSDKEYTGKNQTGVEGGSYVDIDGTKNAFQIGSYSIIVTPKKNYCWSDKTTTPKQLTWNIVSGGVIVRLNNKTQNYNGSSIEIDDAVVTDYSGMQINGISVSYKYYNGNSCSGTQMSGLPINAGGYSVKAYTEAYGDYDAAESNCAVLTVNRIDPTMTVSTNSLSLSYPTDGSFTFTYNGDGNVTCSSSSTSIATCSVTNTSNNKTVTVTPVASSGNATITLSASQGTNYNAASKNVSVSISTGTLSGGSVTITGTNASNSTLTASVTNTNPTATYSYQWYSNSSNNTTSGTAINGATSSTYTIASSYIGKYIYVVVTATKEGYTSKTFSDITDASTNGTSTVSKQTPTLTLDPNSFTLEVDGTGTSTITYNGDGTVSCTTSNSSVATCEITNLWNSKSVTVTAKASGNATITVSASEGTNYAATSKTISVTVSSPKTTPTLTLNPTSLTLNTNSSGSSTYSYNGDGTVTCSSSNSNVATCTVTNSWFTKTINVTSKSAGSATITVSASEGTNYAAISKDLSVTVNKSTPTMTVNPDTLSLDTNSSGTSTFTYNGDGTVTCSSSNSNVATCTVTNSSSTKTVNITSKNAGSATITLSAAEGTNYAAISKDITVTVSTPKTTPTMTLNPTSLTLDVGGTGTSTFTYNGDGTLSCTTSNSSVATCTVTNSWFTKSVTVTAKAAGNATITLSATEGTNYAAISKDLSVTVNASKTTPTLTLSPTSLSLETNSSGTSTFTYNGDGSITCSSSNTNVATCTVTNTSYSKRINVTSKNAGNATITVNASEGTNYAAISKDLSVTVNASKTTPTMTVSPSSLTLDTNSSGSSTFTYNGDGTVSCTTSNSNVATCTVTNTAYSKKVNITSKNAGNATITLSATEGTNYAAISKTITVTVNSATTVLTTHITNLYNNNKDSSMVTNNGISYRYASSVNLMNDRKGSSSTSESGGNIRYYGASPKNYIYFNCSNYSNQTSSTCEVWRIIGIVDGKVKIMRNSSIGKLSWDQDKNQNSSLTTYNSDWSNSSLQAFLNGKYYNRGTTTSLTYYTGETGSTTTSVNLSSIGIKNDATRGFISSSTWYLRGINANTVYSDQMYNYERSSGGVAVTGQPTTITKNIGVIYVSDYSYAVDFKSCSQYLRNYNDSGCTSTSWIKSIFGSSYTSFMAPSSYESTAKVFGIGPTGSIGNGNVYETDDIFPTLYLNSNAAFSSGDGSSGNPYKLSAS